MWSHSWLSKLVWGIVLSVKLTAETWNCCGKRQHCHWQWRQSLRILRSMRDGLNCAGFANLAVGACINNSFGRMMLRVKHTRMSDKLWWEGTVAAQALLKPVQAGKESTNGKGGGSLTRLSAWCLNHMDAPSPDMHSTYRLTQTPKKSTRIKLLEFFQWHWLKQMLSV